ncbi:MAG: iron dicitrate transport regulator FecR [Cytophagales bacterium CG12_big_fil_rev_8_21_14_0_65_40_12]|nr:MAG: iron dicitrate transport regulator FecR [Cytophagales bacterium CG12_big_fil_rev_8_21_14_0_65_40_12]PIW06252.1 MAG: iron dicitrate transport regulator FecR [Cytophagales bacterium CG17_big_fil_post_rev_8_21_14_2_50_40_13]
MADKNINKDSNSAEEQLFSKLELSYKKSKADVWSELEGMMGEAPTVAEAIIAPKKVKSISWISYSIAASIILFLTFGLFARLYTKTVEVGAGELSSHTLPDGSIVHLNAVSGIHYNPYWWRFNREVGLEGEAFFEVEKGERFTVISKLGSTQVLGTKFNIYARGNAYEVFCESGKVQVSDSQLAKVILLPGEFAEIKADKVVKSTEVVQSSTILAWRRGQFMYNTTPFAKVFSDLERQYDVKIQMEDQSIATENYTGIFERPERLEDALQIICLGFDLTFERKTDGSYLIKKK